MLRAEMIDLEEPDWYNSFVRGFKERLLKGDLGGERREMWEIVRKEGLGLVSKAEAESSSVGEAEVAKVSFLSFFYYFLFFFLSRYIFSFPSGLFFRFEAFASSSLLG